MKKYMSALCVGFLFVTNLVMADVAVSNTAATLATDIEVVAGYVRVPIPGQKNTAAFGEIKNTGKQTKQLVAVTTDIAARAEVHSHTMVDGLMRMRQVKKIDIPAGSQVTLAPGGFHIMLFDVKGTLQTGAQVALTLKFSDGSSLPLRLPVKSMYDHAHH